MCLGKGSDKAKQRKNDAVNVCIMVTKISLISRILLMTLNARWLQFCLYKKLLCVMYVNTFNERENPPRTPLSILQCRPPNEATELDCKRRIHLILI